MDASGVLLRMPETAFVFNITSVNRRKATPMARRHALAARWLAELRSLTPMARLALGVVAGLVVIGSAWLALRDTSGQRVQLFETGRFSDKELSSIRTAFESAGLRDYTVKAGRIEIPKDQSARYLAALAQGRDLPYRFFEEVLKRRDWFTSQGDLDRQWDLATQQFLAEIIREFPGVEKAWVRWSAAAKPGLRVDEDVRASVVVKMISGYRLQPRIEEAIQDLIVGSRAGLSPANVSVVDLSEMTQETAASAYSGAEELEQVRRLEQHYTEKLEKLLAFIEGVVVSVNVTLAAPEGLAGKSALAAPGDGEAAVQGDAIPGRESTPVQQQAPVDGAEFAAPPPIVASQSAVMLSNSSGATPQSVNKPLSHRSGRPDLLPGRIVVTVGVPDEYFSQRGRDGSTGGAPAADLQGENDRIRRLVVAALPTLKEPVTVAVHRYRRRDVRAESGLAGWLDFGGVTGVQVAAAMALLTAALLILAVRSAMLSRKLRRRGPVAGAEGVPGPHSRQIGGEVRSMVQRDAARTAQVLQNWIREGNQP
jgi:type III secretory pathway lipoprotein EscJ